MTNRRDDQIAEIVARRTNLDAERLEAFYSQVRDAYRDSSIIDRVATVLETTDRTPSDFRIFTNQELRRIDHFNDPSYFWDMYCKDLGRSVALGEEAHLFEVVQERVPDVSTEKGVGFEGLDRVIQDLVSHGYSPDVILAPISYMVGFFKHDTGRLQWDADGKEYLRFGGVRLEMYWSSNGRPLNRFIVFDHTAGVWHLKLDPLSGDRLTVAIGEQVTPVHGVIWLAETVGRYETRDLGGFRSFRPDVGLDSDFDSVR